MISYSSQHAPDVILPAVLKYFGTVVQKPELRQVSMEEYAIFITPDGTLYDQSVLKVKLLIRLNVNARS